MIKEFLFFIAVCVICCILIRIFSTSILPFLFREQNIVQKYGRGCAIVTGGTDGIGLQIAKKLMEQGMDVMIVGLKTEKIQKRDLLQNSVLYECDLCEPAANDYLCDWISVNRPTLMVLAAGMCKVEHFDETYEPGEYIDAHIKSLVRLTSAFLKVRKGNGGLVFFSSQVSLIVSPFGTLYASSKAFIAQFANSLAAEYPNIDVLCLRPGAVVRTSFFNLSPDNWYIRFVQMIGNNPETIVSVVFKSLGRITMIDIGILTVITRLFVSFFDENIVKMIGRIAAIPLRKTVEKKKNIFN